MLRIGNDGVKRHPREERNIDLPGARKPFNWSHYVHDRMHDHKLIDESSHQSDVPQKGE